MPDFFIRLETPVNLPEVDADGVLLLCDPHIALDPPFERGPGYKEQCFNKLRAFFGFAIERNLLPVFLGDMFHWPGEVPDFFYDEVCELFVSHSGPLKPRALIGNHDISWAMLDYAPPLERMARNGLVILMKHSGPQLRVRCRGASLLLGGSPNLTTVPDVYDKLGDEVVLWCTHHNFRFPGFPERRRPLREIPGVDWVVNAHLHKPQEMVIMGQTRWLNPGGMMRVKCRQYNVTRKPKVVYWTPDCQQTGSLHVFELPHLPFSQIMPKCIPTH